MAAYVVRHADAGHRQASTGDDRLRPLTHIGKRQAEALAESLKQVPIDKIVSSPYRRCFQTVEPLAAVRNLPVEATPDLAEGAGVEGVLRSIKRFPGTNVVLCTHGDVVEELLERLIAEGVVSRSGAKLEKASTWVLAENDGRITAATYRPAPAAGG